MAKKVIKKVVKKTTATTRNVAKKPSNINTDDFFANSKPQAGFFNLPEGTYEGYIKAGSGIVEPKEDGGHKASFVLTVTSPEEYENKEQTARFDLSTQLGVDIFTGQLDILGLGKPDTAKEAAEVLVETDNVPVRFWVGPQKDEFPPKVRINERLEDDEASNEPDNPAESEGEPEEYTKKDIKNMTEDELDPLARELEIDPDEYETWDEVRNLVCEALRL